MFKHSIVNNYIVLSSVLLQYLPERAGCLVLSAPLTTRLLVSQRPGSEGGGMSRDSVSSLHPFPFPDWFPVVLFSIQHGEEAVQQESSEVSLSPGEIGRAHV